MRSPNVARRWVAVLWLALFLAGTTATHAQTLEEAKRLHEKVTELLGRERFAEALPLAQQVLAIREQQLRPVHPDTAKSLNNLATIQLAKSQYALAEPLCRRALAILEKVYGPNHPDTIAALNILGQVHVQTGAYAKAEPLRLRVQALGEKVLGPEHPLTAHYLGNLAVLYIKMGQYDRAEPMALRALAATEKAQGSEHVSVATLSDSLGLLYLKRGEYARAEPLFKRTLRIREKEFGSTHPATATALDHLAVLYDNTGALRRAETLLLRVIAIRERALGATDEFTGLAVEHLGVVYWHTGELAKAETLLQRAIRINEQRLGSDHPDTAWTLTNLAAVYFDMAAYPKAEELNQRALKIREQAFGNEHPAVAMSLNSLAMLNAATGAYAQAESLFQRALSMREKLLGPAQPFTAYSTDQLARLYRTTGELDKAQALLQRTMAIRETALGREHHLTLSSVSELGSLYRDTGAYEQSEKLLQRALDGQQRVLPADHPALIATLRDLAKLYYVTGVRTPGVRLQARACNLQRQALGVEHPDTVACLNDLALMHWGMGAPALAASLLAEAQAVQARNSLRLLLSGSELRKRAYLQTVAADVASHVSFSVAVPGTAAVELGVTDVLQYKGLLQDAMTNSTVRLRQHSSAQDRELLDELAAIANQFSNLIYQTRGEGSLESYRKHADELEREQQRLEAEIAKRNATLRHQVTPVRLTQIRALLPRDALLIEWLRYRPRAVSGAIFGAATKVAAPRYVAYLISQRSKPVVVDMGDAESLDALVVDFRRAAGDPQRSDYRDQAAALAQRIYAPLQPYLGDYRQLLVSPDGALNLVPMGALLDEQGKHLLERFEINYLSSGRDLLAMASEERAANEPLVIAAPSYGETTNPVPPIPTGALSLRSADLDRSGLRFRPLPGAMREGRDIGRLLGLGPRNVLLQSDATEAALKRLRSPRILHIATHGFFLSDQDASSVLRRDPNHDLNHKTPGLSEGAATISENPLLRSGLAFAGANVRRSGEREDGILTALELAQLELHGTQLVVLSACESGVGEIQNGDGVNGLRRALALAGAQAQLTSLWKVADLPTQELMIDYYRRLLRGVGRSAALREAQLAIKASSGHSHPYYWAAFVPIGNWRPLQGAVAHTAQESGSSARN